MAIQQVALYTPRSYTNTGIRVLLILSFLGINFLAFSQADLHFVYFKDKDNSPFSINSPEEFLSARSIERRIKQNIQITEKDLPVNPHYVDSLNKQGVIVKYTSRWFNAALIEATDDQIAKVMQLPIIVNSAEVSRKSLDTENSNSGPPAFLTSNQINEHFGRSLNQLSMLGIDRMHGFGYRGEGMLIGVFDSGFLNVNSLSIFDSLFLQNRVVSTYDFPDKEENVYDDHDHGTAVLSIIAGFAENKFVGSAWKSNFILLRTEVASSERLVEEVYWLIGAEYADSAGVDIINSSLGYNTFDNPVQNHSYQDLNGNTTLVTRAAECAFQTGMFVVNSAGNDGAGSWKYIIAPADGPHVLAVGGVDSVGFYAYFSSKGPSADRRVKPDVVAKALDVTLVNSSGAITTSSGTSFSAPIVSGFAAGVWQKYPDWTNLELLNAIRSSGSQFAKPDSLLGFGIPNFDRLTGTNKRVESSVFSVYPNPATDFVSINCKDTHPLLEIVVTDLQLKELSKKTFSKNQTSMYQIGVHQLPAGSYFLILKTQTGNYLEKFVKY